MNLELSRNKAELRIYDWCLKSTPELELGSTDNALSLALEGVRKNTVPKNLDL